MTTHTYFGFWRLEPPLLPKYRHLTPKFDIFWPFKRFFDDNDVIFFKLNVPTRKSEETAAKNGKKKI